MQEAAPSLKSQVGAFLLASATFCITFATALSGGFGGPAAVNGHPMSLFSLDSSTSTGGDDDEVQLNSAQYEGIYNIFSFAIACMGSATVFFFFQTMFIGPKYRLAVITSGLVTFIACYHYFRIFNSFTEAYYYANGDVTTTGVPFNDAYRYVDWLLTVPLLLCELIFVMNLSEEETRSRCFKLGTAAGLMIILGYPGEISDDNTTRWIFWVLAMLPFLYIVYSLYFGLSASFDSQPAEAQSLVKTARAVTVLSWCTYPIVFVFPMLGASGAAADTLVQVGYSIADIIAKPLLGLLCWMIAVRKSRAYGQQEPLIQSS